MGSRKGSEVTLRSPQDEAAGEAHIEPVRSPPPPHSPESQEQGSCPSTTGKRGAPAPLSSATQTICLTSKSSAKLLARRMCSLSRKKSLSNHQMRTIQGAVCNKTSKQTKQLCWSPNLSPQATGRGSADQQPVLVRATGE